MCEKSLTVTCSECSVLVNGNVELAEWGRVDIIQPLIPTDEPFIVGSALMAFRTLLYGVGRLTGTE